MRSQINTTSIPDLSHEMMGEHEMGVTIPVNDEDQVRSLLNHYNA
jgi:hypothetical protein